MKAIRQLQIPLTPKMAAGLLGFGLLLAGIAWAQSPQGQSQAGDLAISLNARRVVKQSDGKERLLAADRAFPGEVIQYDALYYNKSKKPLQNVSPTLPIPKGMVLVPQSASPAPAEASLDGRQFEPIPLKRKITLADGTEQEQEVPSTQYRALRWHLGQMTAGAQATVSARTQLLPVGQ